MSEGDFTCPNCELGTIYMKGDSAGECLHCGWSIWNDDDPGAYPDLERDTGYPIGGEDFDPEDDYHNDPCLRCGPWCARWAGDGVCSLVYTPRRWAYNWNSYRYHYRARRQRRFMRRIRPHRKRGQHRERRFVRSPSLDRVDLSLLAWTDRATDQYYLLEHDKDPNTFIRHSTMWLLFTDEAEYYVVCHECHTVYYDMQWSGSTRGGPGWRQGAQDYLHEHILQRGWCEFCDPVFGNGGWIL